METAEAAIRIARYFIPHAETVLDLMLASEDAVDDDARYVLRWIQRHERREFSKRDAQQHGKRRFPRATDIDPAFDELIRRNYIRLLPATTPKQGRPPSPMYEVNPAVLASSGSEECSQYSHNLAEKSVARSSENTEIAKSETRVQVTI